MKNIIITGTICILLLSCKSNTPDTGNYIISDSLPEIFPLYNDVTIPSNIAPLNFEQTTEEGNIFTIIEGEKMGRIDVTGHGEIDIPKDEWEKLLCSNKGASIKFTIFTENTHGWTRHKSFNVKISNYDIDYGVTFREVIPGYTIYTDMMLTQHNLKTSNEKTIFSTTYLFADNCVNCHTSNRGNPNQSLFHVRSSQIEGGTLIKNGTGSAKLYNMKSGIKNGNFVYPYWHPEGRYIAFSQNGTMQTFPFDMNHRIEVFDTYGMVVVYDTKENKDLRSPLLNDTTYMCNCPAFSADGKKLFFCLSKTTVSDKNVEDISKIRYNLCSIDFDPATGTFGDRIDTVVNAEAMGKSVAFPRPSYDGKYILYSLADYGYFAIHHPESDLWVHDIKNDIDYPLTKVNSPQCESFHNWSSNSHWIVFSSRRYDGYNAYLYFASVDENGKWSKPFMMPRKHPYTRRIESPYSETVPEFITGPVKLDVRNTARILEQNIHTKINH